MHALGQILSLIEHYGYLIVFFGVMLESTGIPIPGETILIAAGFLVHRGTLSPAVTVSVGALGTISGNQIGYWIGRKGGRPFVLRWGHYVGITPERLGRAEGFFAHHGGKAVFLARFVPWLRAFAALVAGIGHMPRRVFFSYNVLAGAVWAPASVTVGYLLSRSPSLVEAWIGSGPLVLVLLLVLALALYLAYRYGVRGGGRKG